MSLEIQDAIREMVSVSHKYETTELKTIPGVSNDRVGYRVAFQMNLYR